MLCEKHQAHLMNRWPMPGTDDDKKHAFFKQASGSRNGIALPVLVEHYGCVADLSGLILQGMRWALPVRMPVFQSVDPDYLFALDNVCEGGQDNRNVLWPRPRRSLLRDYWCRLCGAVVK